MNKIFIGLLVILLTYSFGIADAYAKRFGGGRSFGVSRNVSSFSPNASRTAQPLGAKPASTASRWLGPLAGLAMGGLLASLFMGHGLGSGILSWLLVGGLAFLVFGFIRSRMQPRAQMQSAQANMRAFTPSQNTANFSQSSSAATDFDEAAFLRQAKATFIRLQAAYDNKNLTDIREFTSPEIFAEIQLQIQERGNEINQTEVVNIHAELMDLSAESQTTVASVNFSGSIREEQHAEPLDVKEIWHFHKNLFSQSWIVAGIQQA